jgi:hypothetical protein
MYVPVQQLLILGRLAPRALEAGRWVGLSNPGWVFGLVSVWLMVGISYLSPKKLLILKSIRCFAGSILEANG